MASTALYRTNIARTKLYPLIPITDSLFPQDRNSPFRPIPWPDIFPYVPGKSLPFTVKCQYHLTGGYDFLVVKFSIYKSTSWKI
jgi:hypothetical protein